MFSNTLKAAGTCTQQKNSVGGGGGCKRDRDGLYDGQTETGIKKKTTENREDNNNMSSTGGQTSDNNWLYSL